MKNRIWLAGGIVIVGLAVVMVLAFQKPYVMHGSLIDPPMPAPPISLADTNGQTFDLSQESGKIVLVFFGYTSCTDVCPATLAELRQVEEGLGKQASQVQVVFVTVDPQRDTITQLKTYLSNFSPDFIGLSGTMDQLQTVWKAYGVYVQVQPNPQNPDNYDVSHSSFIYVINQKSQLMMTFPFDTNVNDIIQDLKYLLKEG